MTNPGLTSHLTLPKEPQKVSKAMSSQDLSGYVTLCSCSSRQLMIPVRAWVCSERTYNPLQSSQLCLSPWLKTVYPCLLTKDSIGRQLPYCSEPSLLAVRQQPIAAMQPLSYACWLVYLLVQHTEAGAHHLTKTWSAWSQVTVQLAALQLCLSTWEVYNSRCLLSHSEPGLLAVRQ